MEILRWVRWGREASKVGGRQGREEESRERFVREEVMYDDRVERGLADGRLLHEMEEGEGQVQWWMREGDSLQEGEEGAGCSSRKMGSKREGLVEKISLLKNITEKLLGR